MARGGEMDQQFRAAAAPPEDPGSVPISEEWLTTVCNSNPMVPSSALCGDQACM